MRGKCPVITCSGSQNCRLDISVPTWNRIGFYETKEAAKEGHTEVVNALASLPSCDLSITAKRFGTAADLARIKGHDDIAGMIQPKFKGDFTVLLQV